MKVHPKSAVRLFIVTTVLLSSLELQAAPRRSDDGPWFSKIMKKIVRVITGSDTLTVPPGKP